MARDLQGTDARYDAVVIGAGFAGVTAAREFASAGMRTALIEARDRLGGRTWTTQFEGRQVELGGAWVHWRQPHVWSELTRYGIAIERDEWKYDAALFGTNARRHSPHSAFEQVRRVFDRYVGDYASVLPRPYDPLFAGTEVASVDEHSMQDRLTDLALSDEDQNWVSGLLYEIAGSPLDSAGLLPVLRWLALCDWNSDGWYETNVFRPAGGTRAILDAMLRDARVEVFLSSPIKSIDYDEEAVIVRSRNGATLRSRVGVVAVPVNVWPDIQFDPPLPDAFACLGRAGVGKPHQDKVWIAVEGNVGRVFAQLPRDVPLNFFWTHDYFGSRQVMVGINSNPDLDVYDSNAVTKTIRQHVPEVESVTAVLGQSWSRDEFSKGGNGVHRPRQISRFLAEVQRPVGRLSFATADIASGWFGYIDGAIEMGLRAARQCLGRAGR